MYEINVRSKKEKIIALGIGIGFMFIAIIIQEIIQSIPSLYFIFRFGISNGIKFLYNFEISNFIIYSIFIGGTAAIFQEVFKYISVDTRPKELTIWIGLGFSVVDLIFLYVETVPSLLRNVSILIIAEVILNTISSLIFHPGTALIIKFGQIVNRKIHYLVVAIILHFLLDAGLAYTDVFALTYVKSIVLISGIFWTFGMALSILSLVLGIRLWKRMKYLQDNVKVS